MSEGPKEFEDQLKDDGYGETLKAAEVENVLGVHRQTVLRLVRDGALPAFRVNRHVRVRRRDLAQFLNLSRTR